VDPAIGLKEVFSLGAHFVLYKPVSSERAKSSFRAARALMKSERRRNTRVAVQIPVSLRSPGLGGSMRVTTVDLSEGGMAVSLPNRGRPTGNWQISFALPGTNNILDLKAEFAWEGSRKQAGLRFQQVSPEAARLLQDWLKKNSPDAEKDDPPIRCQLSDLSLGGCYLELSSPFPASSRVTVSMKVDTVEVRAQGVVRVMHPEKGMGVEFTQTTPEHRAALEKFLGVLTENRNLSPEMLVQPDGLESEPSGRKPPSDVDDPLLQLFYGDSLTPEQFQNAMMKQRSTAAATIAAHA
jgi:c-di-GMP-binding flagellar brake protein YcgR